MNIPVGDGILSQIKKHSNTYTFPQTKEELEEMLYKVLIPTEEEINAREELIKRQAQNFNYFTQFSKEDIEKALTKEELPYYYIAMGITINGSGIVGSKHIEVINKVEKYCKEHNSYVDNWVNSAYGKALQTFVKNNF